MRIAQSRRLHVVAPLIGLSTFRHPGKKRRRDGFGGAGITVLAECFHCSGTNPLARVVQELGQTFDRVSRQLVFQKAERKRGCGSHVRRRVIEKGRDFERGSGPTDAGAHERGLPSDSAGGVAQPCLDLAVAERAFVFELHEPAKLVLEGRPGRYHRRGRTPRGDPD